MNIEAYIARAGLSAAMPDLCTLAEAMVAGISESSHVYEPRKQRGRRSVESRGWPERLRNYEWQPRKDFDGVGQARQLARDFEVVARKIDAGAELDDTERETLRTLAKRTFAWGGVERGGSKRNPTADEIAAVITSALRWQHLGNAFMDAGWTKVAAFSTAWVEAVGRTPQIIYDSRVAAGLIRNAERALLTEGQQWPASLSPLLQDRLRSVPGRDAKKLKALKLPWKSGYKSWEPQFFGSLMVQLMRDALNQTPHRYGLMPNEPEDRTWTMRGVEMVLFMDGYGSIT